MAQVRDDVLLRKIAIVLKDLRENMGVSQEEVYLDTNVHIGRIEAGKSNPSISTLSQLMKFFKIKLSDFFARVENKH